MEEKQSLEDGTTMKSYNYSYCHFNRFNRLLTEIANNMPIESGRMSKHNIQAMMNALKDRTISGHRYILPMEVDDEAATYKDKYPEPLIGDKKKEFAVICTMEGTFVHMDLFDEIRRNTYVNKVKACIETLEHRHAYHYRNHMLGANIRKKSIVK